MDGSETRGGFDPENPLTWPDGLLERALAKLDLEGVRLLPALRARRVWWAAGFRSMEAYASQRLGLDPGRVRALEAELVEAGKALSPEGHLEVWVEGGPGEGPHALDLDSDATYWLGVLAGAHLEETLLPWSLEETLVDLLRRRLPALLEEEGRAAAGGRPGPGGSVAPGEGS